MTFPSGPFIVRTRPTLRAVLRRRERHLVGWPIWKILTSPAARSAPGPAPDISHVTFVPSGFVSSKNQRQWGLIIANRVMTPVKEPVLLISYSA